MYILALYSELSSRKKTSVKVTVSSLSYSICFNMELSVCVSVYLCVHVEHDCGCMCGITCVSVFAYTE